MSDDLASATSLSRILEASADKIPLMIEIRRKSTFRSVSGFRQNWWEADQDRRQGLDLSSADTNNEKPDIGNTRHDTLEDRLATPLDIFLFFKGFHPVLWPNLIGVKARKESGRMQTKRVIGQFIPNGAFPWKRLCWQMLISNFSKTVPSMQTVSSSSFSNWKYCLNTEHTM